MRAKNLWILLFAEISVNQSITSLAPKLYHTNKKLSIGVCPYVVFFANFKKHLFFACFVCIIEHMMKTKTLPKSRGFATIVNGKLTVYVGATQREMALKFFNTKVVKVKFDYLGLGRVANVEIV